MAVLFPLLLASNVPTPGSDVTASGNAISGGSHGDSPNPGSAFDNSNATMWASAQNGSGVSGAAYIGQDFGSGVTKDIIQVSIYHGYPGSSHYYITSVLVQASNDGSSWTTAYTWSGIGDYPAGLQVSPQFGSIGACRYWRLLANANTAAGYWNVYEVEMRPAT